MFHLHTEKQLKYFNEVIRLHYEEGYGEDRISKLLPVGHTTASRWIAIFAKEKGKISGANMKEEPITAEPSQVQSQDVKELQKRVKELEAQLLQAEIKAEFYDEMINVAEAKFKIPIRKKAGAKQ
jgi:transposase